MQIKSSACALSFIVSVPFSRSVVEQIPNCNVVYSIAVKFSLLNICYFFLSIDFVFELMFDFEFKIDH